MATKTPRIQVTLSENAFRVVDRLAVLQRSNRSTIIAEVINDLAPVMEGLLSTMEAAAKVREENIKEVRDASYQALDRLQPLMDEAEEAMGLLDLMMEKAARPEPPTSNTGVTIDLTHSKSRKSSSGKKGGK
jgi:glutamine synthetase type III